MRNLRDFDVTLRVSEVHPRVTDTLYRLTSSSNPWNMFADGAPGLRSVMLFRRLRSTNIPRFNFFVPVARQRHDAPERDDYLHGPSNGHTVYLLRILSSL